MNDFNKNKRFSQEEIGKLLNLTHDAISDLENGKRALKISEFQSFSEALDIPPDVLYRLLTNT